MSAAKPAAKTAAAKPAAPPRARLSAISGLAGVVVVVYGALTLLAWFLDGSGRDNPLAGLLSMDLGAASAFVLAGASLRLRQADRARVWPRRLAALFALPVLLLGVVTVAQYLLGWRAPENRFAATSALNFVLLGASLLLVPTARGNQVAQFLTLTAVVITLLSLVSYIPGLSSLQGPATLNPLAPHVALAFIFLGVGLFCEHQKQLMYWGGVERKRLEETLQKAAFDELVRITAQFKTDFLVNMSHEFRTPMNGMLGMLEILSTTALDAQQREYAETARNSAQSLLSTLKNFMDFWESQSGSLTYEPADFDLREALSSSIKTAAIQAQKKGLELAALIGEDCPSRLRGDPQLLKQVIAHLAANAVKFTERGEITVHATKTKETATDVVVSVSISDTGIGIPPSIQSRLFQPFGQGDSSTTRKYGGVGLGLVLSKKMVEIMGGKIGFESTPGSGATFWFSIPFAKPSAPPPAAADDPLRGRRVLVVNDAAPRQSLLHYQLIALGLSTDSAPGLAEAVALLHEPKAVINPYFAVVANSEMSADDLRALGREVKAHPALKLVLLSSSQANAVLPDADAVVQKPAGQFELADRLKEFLERERAPARATPGAAGPRILRVLVADDDKTNQKVALLMLKKLGYAVDLAENGLEALGSLDKSSYDLILMDCLMPEMDGYAATAEIRRREGGRRHTPIIAMTANALKGDRKKCLDAGMDDYLSKPVNLEELSGAIRRWTAAGSGGAGESSAQEELRSAAGLAAVEEPVAATESAAAAEPAAVVEPDAPPAVDQAVLANLLALGDGNDSILKEVVASFLQESAAALQALDAASAAGDPPGLTAAAHKLKGSSGAVGAAGVTELCRRLEELGRAGRSSGSVELVSMLHYEFERVKDELSRRVAV